MIGFLIGTLCLMGFVKTLRRARYGHRGGYASCGPAMGPWGHHHHRRGPWGHPFREDGGPWASPHAVDPARFWLRGLFERLATTPGQERVILEAVSALRAQGLEFRAAAEATGDAAARAFRADSFEVGVIGDAFAKQSLALEGAQKAVVEALHKVHEALDERQRRLLAELLDRGLDLFGRFAPAGYQV